MISSIILATAVGLLVYSFYAWATKHYRYFEAKGLKFLEPTFLLGNTGQLFLLNKYHFYDFMKMVYNQFSNEKVFGIFDFRQPMYFVRDPSAIKLFTVKYFDHFEDRRTMFTEEADSLFGNLLMMMRGDKWRQMRATLSPAFTGSKMRQMFQLIVDCAEEVVISLEKTAEKGERINREAKDLFSRFAIDVIGTCAFGVKVNSIEDPNNEFFQAAQELVASSTNIMAGLKLLLFMSCPRFAKWLGLSLVSPKTSSRFRSMIFDTMEHRKNNNIFRPDLINMLMKVRSGDLEQLSAEPAEKENFDGFATVEESDVGKSTKISRKWSDDELLAQCFLFFIAGFDGPSTQLLLSCYEMAVNMEIQQKLFAEIVEMQKSLDGGRIDYDALQSLKYLDQIVCETLRKWPIPFIDRVCVKNFLLEDEEKTIAIQMEKGKSVWIPVYGLHHDPQFFPNPEEFDPERFSDENKDKIVPGTYLPFGLGPRNCIGSRFALMEIKTMLYFLVLHFSIEPNEQTQIPLKLKKTPFALATEKGLFLEFKRRQKVKP